MSKQDVLRFWSRAALTANPDKCWEWQLSKTHNGYGQFGFVSERGKLAVNVRATRVAYFLHNGHIDTNLLVCHTCDNPGCINPNHLFQGTQLENMQDCIAKGRFVVNKGEVTSKKLKNEDVFKIFELYQSGEKQSKIGELFDLHQCQVSRIVNGKRWAHLQIN